MVVDTDDPEETAPLRMELSALAERQRQLQADREAVLARRVAWKEAQRRTASLTAWCRRVAANLRSLTCDEKRLATEALGVAVTACRQAEPRRFVITMDIAIPRDGDTADTVTRTTRNTRSAPRRASSLS